MPVTQQRALVAQAEAGSSLLARSSFYYQPCGESAYNLELMRLLDEGLTDHNFRGVLGLRDHLRLPSITPCPSLLRDRPATTPNEVWSTDITCVPMAKSFL